MNVADRIVELLDLATPPVAIAFRDSAPAGIPRVAEAAVSGCSYWRQAAEARQAAEGRGFYTEASDHFGCPVGCHTHGIDLPLEKAKELEGLVGTMVELKYLRMEEVEGIPRRTEPFGVALYAPLAAASFEPDVVLITGNAKQMMLLAEAAHAAGISSEASVMGRPTCAAIPAVMGSEGATLNLGCIGNRVYTGLADDELYCAVAAGRLEVLVESLTTIVHANRELEKFHRGRVSRAASQ